MCCGKWSLCKSTRLSKWFMYDIELVMLKNQQYYVIITVNYMNIDEIMNQLYLWE